MLNECYLSGLYVKLIEADETNGFQCFINIKSVAASKQCVLVRLLLLAKVQLTMKNWPPHVLKILPYIRSLTSHLAPGSGCTGTY